MTAMEMPKMREDSPATGGQILRIGLIILASFGVVFAIGIFAGLIGANISRGGAIGFRLIALLAFAAFIAVACGYTAWRGGRAMSKALGTPTTRERRNRIVMFACAALGGIVGMALTLAGPTPLTAFSNAPISPVLAVLLTIAIAVVLPVISIYWHRHVVDEQEAAAYNLGALIGVSVYFMGAPAWWLLWRGGLLPAPDGIVIYFVTITITGVVWLWAKYR